MNKSILHKSIKLAQASIVLAIGISMIACGGGKSSNSKPTTGLSMKVIDAAGSPVEGVTVNVLAQGDPDDVISAANEEQTTGSNGIAKFEASSASKVIKLKASKTGYFGNTISATTDKNSKVTKIVITEKKSLNDSIRYTSASGSGAVGFTVKVTGEASSKPFRAKVVIPPNFLNDKGEAIGDVTLEMAHYSSQDRAALASFPGGFIAQIENASEIDTSTISGGSLSGDTVKFISAGFLNVEIRDKTTGKKITKFDSSTPLTITMGIDPKTKFPLSKGKTRALAVGDIIPVWSYDLDTGKWKYDGKSTVSDPKGDGNYVATYTINHLTPMNEDWMDPWMGGFCTGSLTINQADGTAYPNDLDGTLTEWGFPTPFSYTGNQGWVSAFPSDFGSDITLQNPLTGAIIYTSFVDFCFADITITLPIPTGSSGSGG